MKSFYQATGKKFFKSELNQLMGKLIDNEENQSQWNCLLNQ